MSLVAARRLAYPLLRASAFPCLPCLPLSPPFRPSPSLHRGCDGYDCLLSLTANRLQLYTVLPHSTIPPYSPAVKTSQITPSLTFVLPHVIILLLPSS